MASTSSKKPRAYRTLTLAEKVAVIKEVEKGVKKKSEIAKDFGIAPNTLSTFLKNKDKILSGAEDFNKDRKRLREPENPDIDNCVLKWFKQTREKKVPVNGPLIKIKAEQFAKELGKQNFKASTGWLDGFKERNKISFKAIFGESGADFKTDEESIKRTEKYKIPPIDGWEDVEPNPTILCEVFLNEDKDVAGCGKTDTEIKAEVLDIEDQSNEESKDEIFGSPPDEREMPVPSAADAMDHLREIRRFVESRVNVGDLQLKSLDILESFIMVEGLNAKIQAKISSFFEKQ